MTSHLSSLEWATYQNEIALHPDILNESFELGRQFMLNGQTRTGNFRPDYDFVNGEIDEKQRSTRQSSALWGLALMYQYEQDPKNRAALDKALRFFLDHTHAGPVEGSLLIAYPGKRNCGTATVAQVALGIIEYLHTEKTGKVQLEDTYREELIRALDGYITHLKFMQQENKRFSSYYALSPEREERVSKSYEDGEALLCLVKAAKYLHYADLIPTIEATTLVLAKHYTSDQWQNYPDSKDTKEFFRCGSMAFWEYQDAGWENATLVGDSLLALAWWMVHTHRVLERTRNTAYAYEGLIHAYRLAKIRNHQAATH